jgi:multidrug transporter EmrE-like cation transporter
MPTWLPWWFVASLMANVAINVIEFMNRTASHGTSFPQQLLLTWWLILVAQFGLFHAWKGAPSMMIAWAVFSSMNALMRLVSNHFFLGEPLSWQGWAGVAVMFAGMYLVKTAH